MKFKIPQSLKTEHEKLHAELVKATEVRDTVGRAAKAVSKVLHPHFVKEEEFALPPLGLLPSVADGKVTPAMGDVLSMTNRLKAELDEMLEEHKAIVSALETLSEVAKRETKPE